VTGNIKNIEHLSTNKHFEFLKHDITKPLTIAGRVDYIMHFASPASPIDYLELPIPTLKVGSLGTHNALGLAKAKKARVLLASTSEVYGDPLEHPQKETYWGNVNPVGPRGVYDEAKRFAEAITLAYHRFHNVDTKIVRIFNTYGPRMRINDGRVVPNFIHQALHGQPMTIYGKGTQTRSFCYMDDLIDGILKLLYSDITGPVNIGNPREFTILEFAEMVNKISHKKSKLVFKPLPKDDPRQRKPDITLAKKKLGWTPKVKLEDGLKRTIAWFEERM
jgi:dTDP-glucose 4,6-dehydratase